MRPHGSSTTRGRRPLPARTLNFALCGVSDGGRALSLTLVIHELATNAAKYGALSVPGGSLTVDWVVQGSVLRLTWTERGGPEVQQPDRRGFGSRLIDRSLQSHGGHATLTFRPSGLEAELTLPLQERRSTSHSRPGS